MKKYLILVLAIMLFCCVPANAQAPDTDLNILTIGNLFKWSYDRQQVYETLNLYEGLLTEEGDDADSDSIYIGTQGENENGLFFYFFYFDKDTDILKEIECVEIYYDDNELMTAANEVIDAYDLYASEPYEDSFTIEYASSFDGSMTVAGDKTICIFSGKDPTEEYYGYVSLVFLSREYF